MKETKRLFLTAVIITLVGAIAGFLLAGVAGPTPAAAGVPQQKPGPPRPVDVEYIAREPTDLPPPLDRDNPATVEVQLEAREVVAEIEDGTTFVYWTFNGKVPGPFLRVRVGDTVIVHFKNHTTSTMFHSVDFHAVTGPGGGAVYTQTPPGEEKSFQFMALHPGIYVYHCASPNISQHISKGLYGLILVEPEGGLPPVDREFYVMQGDFYTVWPAGTKGHQEFAPEKVALEQPTYVLFNGRYRGLTGDHALRAQVGETIRIYFGVGGPNLTSSFHVIGEIFDRVYNLGSLVSPPLQSVQTVLVPPGGAIAVDIHLDVPGDFILVDHALVRTTDKGALAILKVEGPENPEIFSGSGEHSAAGHQ